MLVLLGVEKGVAGLGAGPRGMLIPPNLFERAVL